MGNDLALDCLVPPSDPPALVQFYKDGEALSGVEEEEEEGEDRGGGRLEVLNGGETLLVRDVGRGDAGKYTCGATNQITSQTRRAPGKIFRIWLSFGIFSCYCCCFCCCFFNCYCCCCGSCHMRFI